MHTIETYAILDNSDKIVRVYETSDGMSGVEQAMMNENIEGTIQLVPNGFEGHEKNHKDEFTEDWKYKPLKERVADGYVVLPENHTIDSSTGYEREKTLKEKLDTGTITLGFGEKYDVEKDAIVIKPWSEIVADGEVNYEKWLDSVVRPARNQKLSFIDTVYCNPERWWGYTEAEKTAWSEYKQALRDLPSKMLDVVDDPALLPWPETPGGIKI